MIKIMIKMCREVSEVSSKVFFAASHQDMQASNTPSSTTAKPAAKAKSPTVQCKADLLALLNKNSLHSCETLQLILSLKYPADVVKKCIAAAGKEKGVKVVSHSAFDSAVFGKNTYMTKA